MNAPSLDFQIRTDRFLVRPLRAPDATPRYSAWLDDPDTNRFVMTASAPHSPDDLRRYIEEKRRNPSALLLGIFDAVSGAHIGNIKFEPMSADQGWAVFGILIGDPGWRGKGVAGEVVRATALWLKANRGIREILLGVDLANMAAINAYRKMGFSEYVTDKIRVIPGRTVNMRMMI